MRYEDWLTSVPAELSDDTLWRMEVYRLGVFAGDVAWRDVSKLVENKRTISLADQLYRSVCSVSANIAEGYSRQSGKDQARFYEYALGSAREARNWYYHGRHVLTEVVSAHRMQLLTGIIRLLLTIIPVERSYKSTMHDHSRHERLKEEQVSYNVSTTELADKPLTS